MSPTLAAVDMIITFTDIYEKNNQIPYYRVGWYGGSLHQTLYVLYICLLSTVLNIATKIQCVLLISFMQSFLYKLSPCLASMVVQVLQRIITLSQLQYLMQSLIWWIGKTRVRRRRDLYRIRKFQKKEISGWLEDKKEIEHVVLNVDTDQRRQHLPSQTTRSFTHYSTLSRWWWCSSNNGVVSQIIKM